jgi:hypothetical protein
MRRGSCPAPWQHALAFRNVCHLDQILPPISVADGGVEKTAGKIERAFEEETHHDHIQGRERLKPNGAISIRTCGTTD